ncbi:hypothetical protein COOONC_00317, partial [Cooperia oncophora]
MEPDRNLDEDGSPPMATSSATSVFRQDFFSRKAREVKENCGKHFLEDRKSFKSFGGRKLKLNEFPWIATVSARGSQNALVLWKGLYFTGAATGAFSMKRSWCRRNVPHNRPINRRRFRASVSEWMVKFGSLCPKICVSVDTAKIYVHDKFDECSAKNDIAIFELAQTMTMRITTHRHSVIDSHLLESEKLVKTQQSQLNLLPELVFVRNRSSNDIQSQKPVALSLFDGLQSGDSGGPLFQVDEENRSTLMGILSHGSSCEWNFYAALKRQGEDVFTDVREYLDWIHEKSGVDPAERSQTDGSAEQSQTEQNMQNNRFGIVRDVASITDCLKWVYKIT